MYYVEPQGRHSPSPSRDNQNVLADPLAFRPHTEWPGQLPDTIVGIAMKAGIFSASQSVVLHKILISSLVKYEIYYKNFNRLYWY